MNFCKTRGLLLASDDKLSQEHLHSECQLPYMTFLLYNMDLNIYIYKGNSGMNIFCLTALCEDIGC